MWTPSREDLLIELCGEIEDEDKSLIERAEERSERFNEYSDRRAEDAAQAQKAVSVIADAIPFGQPILIGHHSERRARKDAQRIEDGMRRTVRMWDTSKYWIGRAASARNHAKYKERSDVRARRIKTLEADKRKQERNKQEAEMWLKLWTECANEQDKELQASVALRIAGMCHLTMPRTRASSHGTECHGLLESLRQPAGIYTSVRSPIYQKRQVLLLPAKGGPRPGCTAAAVGSRRRPQAP